MGSVASARSGGGGRVSVPAARSAEPLAATTAACRPDSPANDAEYWLSRGEISDVSLRRSSAST